MPRPVVTRQSVETAAAVREHRSGLASSIAIALASLCIGALAAFAYRTAPQIANMSAPRPAAETRAQPATESTGPIASPAATASLAQVFHAPPVSPRGIAADTRDTPAVLRAANDSLHGRGDTPKDREEAAYWLRTALSRQLSGPGMSWALTQLGAYYAAPEAGTEPDYARARLLWEIAATQSDPVANCFLGQLAEFGLGQPKDPAAARTYYADAVRLGGKQQSGCHGLEAALARLSD